MKIPVRKWSCSQHDHPQQCECCERWDCDECSASEWAKVGERDASPYEEMLLSLRPSFPQPVLFEEVFRHVP